MSGPIAQPTTLQVARAIPARRERVFSAWTTPAKVLKWFGPETCQALEVQLEPEAGGHYRIRMKTETFGELEVSGVFREVRAGERLVYTWTWQGHPALEFGETLVTVEFVDTPNGSTEVRLTHERFPNPAICEDHNHGWNGCFDKLERQLAATR